jgi:hypothetical protein
MCVQTMRQKDSIIESEAGTLHEVCGHEYRAYVRFHNILLCRLRNTKYLMFIN